MTAPIPNLPERNMTDTPETNAAEFPCMRWLSRDHPMGVRSSLAKRLERERDELKLDLADMTKQRDRLAKACDQYSEDEILCKLQEITEQRDRLAVVVQGIRSGFGGQIPDPTCDCGDCEFLIKIDNALQYLTKPN